MLASSAVTIGASRTINYWRERRRSAPALRSLLRRAYHAPGGQQLRIHHFLPGMAISTTAGAAAILTRRDGHEFWLSLPFGTGTALILDEVAMLIDLDNPYWGTERLAFLQGGLAALGAVALTVRFYRNGVEAA